VKSRGNILYGTISFVDILISYKVAVDSLKDQISGTQRRLMDSLNEIETLNVSRHKIREALDVEIAKVAAAGNLIDAWDKSTH
jgi:regulator of replication initiation timing